MAKRKARRLPSKLSSLLDLAVTDAMALEKSKRYALNMFRWHVPDLLAPPKERKCVVCMAGAVIARELGAKPTEDCYPVQYSDAVERKLLAIDNLRSGDIGLALRDLKIRAAFPSEAEHVIRAGMNKTAPGRADWSDYRKAAEILRKAGL